jgi:hypothetical protein
MSSLKSGSVDGSSMNGYVAVFSFPLTFHRVLGQIIKNTGGNDLLVKITTKMSEASLIEYEELGETQLAAGPGGNGSLIRYFEKDLVGIVTVYVKSFTPDQPSSYLLEWAVDRP